MKKTTKILLTILIIINFIISISALNNISGMKFKNIDNRIESVDISNIKYLIVKGNINLHINLNEKFDKVVDMNRLNNQRLGFQQRSDSLFVYIKNNGGNAYGYLNKCDNLIYIKAEDYAMIFIESLMKENPVIEAINSSVQLYTDNIPLGLTLIGKMNSSFYVGNYPNFITVDLNGKTNFHSIADGIKIKGIIKNKSVIDISGKNCNLNEVIKKDSAAVVYR